MKDYINIADTEVWLEPILLKLSDFLDLITLIVLIVDV